MKDRVETLEEILISSGHAGIQSSEAAAGGSSSGGGKSHSASGISNLQQHQNKFSVVSSVKRDSMVAGQREKKAELYLIF